MTTFRRLDDDRGAGHWAAHAQQWSSIGSPLRPHADDIAVVRRWLADDRLITKNDCGVLLGVTPELVEASAPRPLIAIDRERAMIDMLLRHEAERMRPTQDTLPAALDLAAPQTTSCNMTTIQGDWLALPFADRSLAFGIGDGSFNLLRYPRDYHALFAQLRRAMRNPSILIMRVFTRPATDETCAAVVADAFRGRIASFHAFKWRFAMALVTRNRNPNIGVDDIHREFTAWIPDRDALAVAAGWPRGAIDTLDVYRGSDAIYSFPSGEEWDVVAERYGIELERTSGAYELAERCPIILHQLLA